MVIFTLEIVMDQHDLNRAVAQATGESISTIAALGFSLLSLPPGNDYFHLSVRRRQQPRRMGTSRQRRPVKRSLKKRADKCRLLAA